MEMPTLKNIYFDYYTKLITILPMQDATFMARLNFKGILPGDAMALVEAKATSADRATYFLDHYIGNKFHDDDSNQSLSELLDLLEHCEHPAVEKVAREMKSRYVRMCIHKYMINMLHMYVCM